MPVLYSFLISRERERKKRNLKKYPASLKGEKEEEKRKERKSKELYFELRAIFAIHDKGNWQKVYFSCFVQ